MLCLWPTRGFSPANVAGLAIWCRFNRGITVTGSGVSQWDDQSGNNRHLLQATDANRPAKQADGSIVFDGLAFFLKANAFTHNQPLTTFLLMKQLAWTSGRIFCGGNVAASAGIRQGGSTPQMQLVAGSAAATNGDLTLNTYGVVTAVINGASSTLQVNSGTATTGDPGANAAAGFSVGATGAGTLFANVQVKEVLSYSGALSAANAANVIAYLQGL